MEAPTVEFSNLNGGELRNDEKKLFAHQTTRAVREKAIDLHSRKVSDDAHRIPEGGSTHSFWSYSALMILFELEHAGFLRRGVFFYFVVAAAPVKFVRVTNLENGFCFNWFCFTVRLMDTRLI